MTRTCDICYKESDLLIRVLNSNFEGEYGEPTSKEQWICYACLTALGLRS